MTNEAVRELLCTYLREKPETQRASRKLGKVDFSTIEHMGLNENVFGMSPKAIEAMAAVAPNNKFYADWMQVELKEAIGDHYGVTPDFILTGCGSSAVTDALGVAFLEKGDEVLMCVPTFPALVDTAQINGASVVTIPTKEDLTFDLDGLLENITEKDAVVIEVYNIVISKISIIGLGSIIASLAIAGIIKISPALRGIRCPIELTKPLPATQK